MKHVNDFFITVPVTILREGKKFIAYSPALDLSTSGRTFKQAKERLDEAVSIFVEECAERGTLDVALNELGWRKIKAHWEPPKVIAYAAEKVRVGFRL